MKELDVLLLRSKYFKVVSGLYVKKLCDFLGPRIEIHKSESHFSVFYQGPKQVGPAPRQNGTFQVP